MIFNSLFGTVVHQGASLQLKGEGAFVGGVADSYLKSKHCVSASDLTSALRGESHSAIIIGMT